MHPTAALPLLLPVRCSRRRAVSLSVASCRCQQLLHFLPARGALAAALPIIKLLAQPWEGDITFVLPRESRSVLPWVHTCIAVESSASSDATPAGQPLQHER